MLKCKVGGYPAPKVMWYKDGTQLVNEAPYELFSDGGEQSLFFPQAEEEDGGVFSCLATNPSGQDVSSCNVTVAGWCLLVGYLSLNVEGCRQCGFLFLHVRNGLFYLVSSAVNICMA